MKYSQNDEEAVILEIFGEKTDGRFLDIGAYDAKMLSNTRALYERGWSGVMVEPSPGPFRSLLEEYGNDPRITLVHAAIGITRRVLRMYATDDAITTTSETMLAAWKAAGYEFYGSFLQPIMAFGNLLVAVGSNFDFVSVDVEGGSADLFVYALSCIQPSALPKCWCVEHDNRPDDLVAKATPYGYRLASRNGENCIFVREGAIRG